MTLFEIDARDEGRAEGRAESSIMIAENLIHLGMNTLEDIARVTNLQLETVKELAEKKTV